MDKVNAETCDQCGKCPSSCPVTVRVEGFNPRQIIAKVALGKEAELMKSQVLWTCTSCLKCKERCPEEISPYDVILALRRIAINLELPHPEGYDESVRAVVENGVVQQPQLIRTRNKERKDRKSMGLPPAEKPRDMTTYTKTLRGILEEDEL
jgi:heterodisulfide reductase subunit C